MVKASAVTCRRLIRAGDDRFPRVVAGDTRALYTVKLDRAAVQLVRLGIELLGDREKLNRREFADYFWYSCSIGKRNCNDCASRSWQW